MKSRNLIQPEDFSIEETNQLLELAQKIIDNPSKYANVCEGKLLATLFFEPSTRTRLSFESAMFRLGGKVVGFSDSNSSSTTKGESLEDTVQTVSGYVDLMAIRHPKEGGASVASEYSEVPVINAGDGGNQHPTQTLADLLTIKSLKGSLDNHTVGLCGDLKYGRTVHSLVRALTKYNNIKFVFISPDELAMPDYIIDELDKTTYTVTDNLESVIDDLDILYMTRVQEERFENRDDYERLKHCYRLNKGMLTNAKEDMLIMHPLPRNGELDPDVDSDKRAVYFKQTKFGMYARMALIMMLLDEEE